MVSVSSEAPPRYKKRKVFAERHFPRGCGPKEMKSCTTPVGETSSPVMFENGEVTDSESKLVANLENGNLEVRKSVRGCSELSEFGNGHCYSKLYGAPKRRKQFPVRQFPLGCGPNNDDISKILVGKKVDEVSKHFTGDSTIRVADAEIVEEQANKNAGIKAIIESGEGIRSETGFGPQVSSIKHKILEWEKKHADVKQRDMAGCSASVQYENKLHPMKNMALVKQPVAKDKYARVEHFEKHSNHGKSMAKLVATVDGSVRAENRNNSNTTKGEVKASVKSILVRSNTDKNIYGSGTQGNVGHVHIKSPLKLGSNVIFDRSLSDKTLGSCRVDQADKNIQIRENVGSSSHGVLKSNIGSKLLYREGKTLAGKDLVKESEIAQRVNDSLKGKFSAEIDYKEHISVEDDDSLEAYGERMIIQALLDAQHFPSRNSRKIGAVGSPSSVFPKPKTKEKDLIERNSASKVLPSFQQKSKGHIEDIDSEEGRSWKKLDTFRKPIKSILTTTPSFPFKFSKKSADKDEILARHRVKRVLRNFQLICRKLLHLEESHSKKLGKINRVDLQASKLLKYNGEWVSNGEPVLGHVLGVEVGDEFHYRVELSMIGLHRLFQGGIDSMKRNKMLVAISIVASGGYDDDVDGSDVLIYSGSGGTSAGDKQPEDQKLERGNLALKNSIEAQTPVRVILGFKEKVDPFDAKGKLVSIFTYAGLYHVESYWKERGSHGFNVFKFQLKRKPGQPELAFKEIRRSTMLRNREGLRVKDITQGKEKIPISVVNTIDNDLPNPFKYITKNIYPLGIVRTPPRGCACIHGCLDSENCTCAVKNGGEIPYNFSGAIVQAKPLIYECGPSCKCPPSCYNRVVQHGIQIPLEVFKTRGRGWGVRSLKSISSGSFICAYLGELLRDGEAEQRKNDEYLFDIGHNYDDQSLWEGLPNLIPELQSSSSRDTVENVGFTIDAAEFGNIGRFINHSCSPNLYAQNVLYDHDDKRTPHIMFFAMDNIPPLQELTYHYNYAIDQIRDSEGNVKQKACHCGSPECRGRLY